MAEAQVEVPGVGRMDKRYVIGGVSIVGGYVLYRYWKAKRDAAAAPVPVAGDAEPVLDSGGGGGAYVNPAPGGGGGGSAGASAPGSAPQTDQQWTAAVIQDLGDLGYNPQTVDEALAKYLAGQPLSPAEVMIIRQAWAHEGRPPGHPSLPIIQAGGSDTTTPTPTPTPTPEPTPQPQPQPTPTPAPAPAPTVHRYPEWRKSHTNMPGESYASIAASEGTGLTGPELLAYQFTAEAGRPASTLASLRARNPPDKIYAGGETEIPYPR